jgi:hypothetical protein
VRSIYDDEMDFAEREWDEPGPDFGATILRNRYTGETWMLPYEEDR